MGWGEAAKTALICGNETRTFAEMEDRARRVAAVIERAGAGPGDRVAVMLPNSIEFIEASLAAGTVGCPVVPINWHLRGEEAAWLLEDSEAKVLFVHRDFEATARTALARRPDTTLVLVPDGYGGALAETEPKADGELAPPVYLYYTSGTTGRPRGVEREGPPPDPRMLMAGLAAMWGITAGDVWLACSPLYHAANAYSFVALVQGATVVVQPRWDAADWLDLVDRHRVTACFMVPAHFIRLLEIPPEERAQRDLSSLRLVLHSAAPCPVPVKWQILEALPSADIWEFYGATEGGATRISSAEWRTHPGSVGTPWPGVEVVIRGDDGRACPPGEDGVVYIKPAGGSRFRYRNDEGKTGAAWRDGFFTVGEIGHLDADGFLYLTDRASDMVLRGGVNIYPAEIEAALHGHPAVVDCAVFGVPDRRSGEELKALVEVRSATDPAELAAYLRTRLADFKVPRVIELVDSLPRDPSGKVAKRLLRDAHRTQPVPGAGGPSGTAGTVQG